ncbi:MAG: Gfo/Idh/MocA family oxidoreductase [Elusimicrobia bacterium]|nr:Gfo/Idh/MocA family oxidoreductase [Elusimicrobiota bacterium]
MTNLRFAIIGCGRIAKNHVGPLKDSSRAKLVAVCDLKVGLAQTLAAQHGVRAYSNYHQMLAKEKVDVVSILTPSGMHPTHALDVIETYGKHVLVEKPMALSLRDLVRMKTAADRKGVKIFPVYQNRYNKAVQRVRRDLMRGALGKVAVGAVRLRWCRGQAYYDRDPWRGTWAMDGGAFTNQGIHYLDLLQYLLGDPETVYARTATRLVDVEVEDTGVGVLSFESGALGSVEVTTAARPADIEASISILSERGTTVLSGIASNQLVTYTLDPEACKTACEDFPDPYGFGHWPFYADVAADLLDGIPHPVGFQEGTRAIRLLNALYRSAEDGLPVEFAKRPASRKLGKPDADLSRLYEAIRP